MLRWVDAIAISKQEIGTNELSNDQITEIVNLLKAQELDLETIKFQLFSSRLPSNLTNNGFFGLEACITQYELSEEELLLVLNHLDKLLSPASNSYDWFDDNSDIAENYYYKLRVLRVLAKNHSSSVITKLISYHVNPHVPWSNFENSNLLLNLEVKMDQHDFYTLLKPRLIKADTKQKFQGGLNPRLGYGGAKSLILQEDIRDNWKKEHLLSLSMVWYYMNYKDTWPVVTAFVLNLFDDHKPEFKIQALHILKEFIRRNPTTLTKTGLMKEFRDPIKICLSYIPNLTPVIISTKILSLAYEVNYMVVSTPLEYLDIINTILSSISHLSNRSSSDYPILILLVDQLSLIVENYIKTVVLAMFTKINFSLNQMIINPYVIDHADGLKLFYSCLKCQNVILQEFILLGDREGLVNISSYSLDLMGSWLVLLQRMDKADVENLELIHILNDNFQKISQIDESHEDQLKILCGNNSKLNSAVKRFLI